MRNVNKKRAIIYMLGCLFAAFLPIFAVLRGLGAAAAVTGSIIGVIFIALIFVMDKIHQYHEDSIMEDLSLLLEEIINLGDKPMFSEVEETMFSKLQYQVIRLSRIIKTQNAAIENEKNEIKSLISDISHQLKTPVASLKMFGELLSDESITDDQRREYIDVINQSLEKLTFLTDSMIKMSRLESGIISIKKEPCTTDDIILPAIKQALPKARSKNIEIIYDSVPEDLTADTRWMPEAIFNIIENAVKYSDCGTAITITTEKLPSFMCIRIKDQGMGISEEEQALIFKRFYRSERASGRDGMGIGLFLTREITVNQNGYIKVESEPEKGSCFFVYLPIR